MIHELLNQLRRPDGLSARQENIRRAASARDLVAPVGRPNEDPRRA
jgi:hypothetical protein